MVKLFHFSDYRFGHFECLAFRSKFSSVFISKFYCLNIYFSRIFFIFISSGLYFGLKLKDNVGHILHMERIKKYVDKTPKIDGLDLDIPDLGDAEGCGGVILSVILWVLFTVVFVFLLYFLGIFFWTTILFFVAMLYWIFFRALRLVFKNSRQCKGDLLKSFAFGFFYSFLYISWIYGIIFLVNYLS